MRERCSLHCIIPPYMLDSIALRGTPAQQEYARRCLQESARIRTQRVNRATEVAPALSGKQRIVYTANNGTSLPGHIVRNEGQPASGDPAIDEAYDGSGATYDLYQSVYGRESIDGNNLRLDSTVHYGNSFDNAFWDGRQMVYGDGDEDLPADQRLFNRFTASLDVIAHELTHGVTQFTANLVYQNQSGALNEHFSDVFGALVKQWKLQQSAQAADWLIGAELLTDNVRGAAIRSMKAPGTAYDDPVLGRDPQPAHMNDYVNTTQDNGGVHINSGIPNHAFYRIAIAIGGDAWEKAGLIWYRTLTSDRLSANASFQNVADLTAQIAGQEFGAGSAEQQAVIAGWRDVGLIAASMPDVPDTPDTPDDPGPPPAPTPRGCNPLRFLWRGSDS
ncbi:MAG: M4 family metallopeptidase [Gammaproteobacteria bacterium]|jgi:Zn-dependent metalloprotease